MAAVLLGFAAVAGAVDSALAQSNPFDAFAIADATSEATYASSPVLAYAGDESAVTTREGRDYRLVGRHRSEYVHYDAAGFSGGIWTHETGIDYIWNEQLLIGVIGRYDTGELDLVTPSGTFLGEGVTLGLRAGTLLGYGLTLDGNISHTWLEYEIVAGVLSAATQASRVDASINLAGEYWLSDTISVEPNLRYSYTTEQVDAYTQAFVLKPSSRTSSGAVGAGSVLRYTSEAADGSSWSVYVSAHCDYDFALTQGQATSPLGAPVDVLSGRFGVGGYAALVNDVTFYLEGEVDRVGADAYTRYTGTARLSIPLN